MGGARQRRAESRRRTAGRAVRGSAARTARAGSSGRAGSTGSPNRRSSHDSSGVGVGDVRRAGSAAEPGASAASGGASSARMNGISRGVAEAVLARLLLDVAWRWISASSSSSGGDVGLERVVRGAHRVGAGRGLARLAHLAREQDDDPGGDEGAEQERDPAAGEARDGQVREAAEAPSAAAGRAAPRGAGISGRRRRGAARPGSGAWGIATSGPRVAAPDSRCQPAARRRRFARGTALATACVTRELSRAGRTASRRLGDNSLMRSVCSPGASMRTYAPARTRAVLDQLLEEPSLARGVLHHEVVPARDGGARRTGRTWLDPRIRAGLAGRGIERPYIHQAEAIEAVHAGEDIVVVTPTASGKSLCYTVPVLQAHRRGPVRAGAVPVPDQGPRARTRSRSSASSSTTPGSTVSAATLRRRHAGPDPVGDPQGRAGRGHQPGHAPLGDAPPPHEVVPAVRAAAGHRRRRAPHVPRRVRLARRQRPAPAAPAVRPLRVEPGDRVLLGDDREPGASSRSS